MFEKFFKKETLYKSENGLGELTLSSGKKLRPLTECDSCKSFGSQNWLYCPWCGSYRNKDQPKPLRSNLNDQ